MRTVEQLVDRHRGRVGLVLGTGPSIDYYNPDVFDRMPDVVIIGCAPIGWGRFTVYGNEDRHFKEDWFQDFERGCRATPFCPETLGHTGSAYTFRLAGPSGIWKGRIFGPWNTGLFATQLAYTLGLNPIYLSGIDLRFTGERTHFWGTEDEKPSDEEDPFKYANAEKLVKAFERAHVRMAANGVSLINTSPLSLLKESSVPTRPFEDVFECRAREIKHGPGE